MDPIKAFASVYSDIRYTFSSWCWEDVEFDAIASGCDAFITSKDSKLLLGRDVLGKIPPIAYIAYNLLKANKMSLKFNWPGSMTGTLFRP